MTPPFAPVICAVALLIAFCISDLADLMFCVTSLSIPLIVVASDELTEPIVISLYRSINTSYTVRTTFAVTAISSLSNNTVTVSHNCTLSRFAISLYSSVCHNATKLTSIDTLGTPMLFRLI